MRDAGADCHRSVARWGVSTHRPHVAGLTMLAVNVRTFQQRIAQHWSLRSQQKPETDI